MSVIRVRSQNIRINRTVLQGLKTRIQIYEVILERLDIDLEKQLLKLRKRNLTLIERDKIRAEILDINSDIDEYRDAIQRVEKKILQFIEE